MLAQSKWASYNSFEDGYAPSANVEQNNSVSQFPSSSWGRRGVLEQRRVTRAAEEVADGWSKQVRLLCIKAVRCCDPVMLLGETGVPDVIAWCVNSPPNWESYPSKGGEGACVCYARGMLR